MKKTKNRILKAQFVKNALLLLLLLTSLFTLTSCGSFDKDDAEISLQPIRYEYHPETNMTTVYCFVDIQNETVYNIESYALNMKLYSNGVNVANEEYHFEERIKHGEFCNPTVTFTHEGSIDRVEFASWTPNYEPLWKTYINVLVILAALIILGIGSWVYDLFS